MLKNLLNFGVVLDLHNYCKDSRESSLGPHTKIPLLLTYYIN